MLYTGDFVLHYYVQFSQIKSQMCVKMGKIVMISDDYHDIGRLLLLTIIASSKNWTISIIVKVNITVNRQNQLIAHPSETCLIRSLCNVHMFNYKIPKHIIYIQNDLPNAATCLLRSENCAP